jgi:hypothetical protein
MPRRATAPACTRGRRGGDRGRPGRRRHRQCRSRRRTGPGRRDPRGRRVTVRIDATTLTFFDPDTRELLRTRPSPITYDQAARLRGARPAGPPPRPTLEPIRVQRRASNTGAILVTGQRVALGRVHAHTIVTVYVADTTLTIETADGDPRTVARTTSQAVRSIKAHRPRKAAETSTMSWDHAIGSR